MIPNKDFHIHYFADHRNPKRVLTAVSRVVGENLEYAYAVNRPTEWVCTMEYRDVQNMMRIPGDSFNKKMGVKIALGRLQKKPKKVFLDGQDPYDALITGLAHDKCRKVANIGQDACLTQQFIVKMNEIIAQNHGAGFGTAYNNSLSEAGNAE